MGVDILGIYLDTGQVVRVTNASESNFGNVIGVTSVTDAERGAVKAVAHIADTSNDREQIAAWVHGSTTGLKYTYEGLGAGAIGDNWSTAVTLSAVNVARVSGLFPVTIGNEPCLYGVYFSTSSAWSYVRYVPSTNTWSTGSLTGTATVADIGHCMVFKNKLYVQNFGQIYVVDPQTNRITLSTNTPGLGTGSFFIFQDLLHYIEQPGLTGLRVYALEAGTWSTKKDITEASGTGSGSCGFYAEDDTMILLSSRVTVGTKAYSITTGYSETDITANLPSGYASLDRDNFQVIRDWETNGPTGQVRTTVYWGDRGSSSTISVTRVQSASSWTDLGSFGTSDKLVMCDSFFGEGESFYTESDLVCTFTEGFVNVSGKARIKFITYGVSGTYDFELMVAENVMAEKSGTAPAGMFRGTLSNPSGGSLTDSNHKITGLSLDTEYSVEWDYSTDSMSIGDWAVVKPFVS